MKARAAAAGWLASLQLDYRRDGVRTVAHDRHEGPLRVLKALYPEGPAVCHHVIVHPPGGIVGGDTLDIGATLHDGAHALLTTPGATRFYRSDGAAAQQRVELTLAPGARLEWLPLEAIAHSGCVAHSRLRARLAPGAEMIGWDVLALGLPASKLPFDAGSFAQRIEVIGHWLDAGIIDAGDTLLRRSPLGLAGHDVLATAWFAAGQPLAAARRDALLDAARGVLQGPALSDASAGVSAVQPAVIVLRVLAQRVETAMRLLAAVRAAWRLAGWSLASPPPRIWST